MKKKPANIDSNRKLASALGVSESAVRKRLDHPDWPFGKAPWKASDLPKIRSWAASHLRDDNAAATDSTDATSITAARRNLIVVRTQRELCKLSDERQSTHNAAACQAEQVSRLLALKSCLLNYFAPSVAGNIQALEATLNRPATVAEMKDIISDEIHRALRALSGQDAREEPNGPA